METLYFKENQSIRLKIGSLDNNDIAIISEAEPYFCFVEESEEEVIKTALSALSFYRIYKGK